MGSELALALVRAHLMSSEEYLTWIIPYTKVRWCHYPRGCVVERVGGHWRRTSHAKRTIDAIQCVCKQPELVADAQHAWPHAGRRRKRYCALPTGAVN
jgi:hypothetical protein